jgi:hypothetical protein
MLAVFKTKCIMFLVTPLRDNPMNTLFTRGLLKGLNGGETIPYFKKNRIG